MTYAGWANLPSDPHTPYTLIGHTGNYGPILYYWHSTGGFAWYRNDEGNAVSLYPATLPALGSWFHWAIVDDPVAQTTTLYINGVATTVSNTDPNGNAPGLLDIGWTLNPWLGKIDEVGVWNRALSAAEVGQLYNQGNGLQYPLMHTGQWSVPVNLWSSWPWTVSGSGAGLASGDTADQLQWDYQPMNGNGMVSAQVGPGYEFPQVGGTSDGIAQYGVMVRGSSSPNAPYFAAFVSPCQGLGISYRATSGGPATVTYNSTPPSCTSSNQETGLGASSSIQVMVNRVGSSYQAYYKTTGSSWIGYLSLETISAIPNQAPAGDFAASAIPGFQAWANFSSNVVSSDAPTASELLGGGGASEALWSGDFSGPGNAFSGNYVTSNTDLSLSGRGLPLDFTRAYNSLKGSSNAPYGNLGPGWTDNYNMFATADASGNITIQQEDGSAITLTDNGGVYTPPTRVLATLVPNTGQTLAPNCPATALVLTRHDQSKYAFYQITGGPPSGQPSGALCEELDINGYPTELTYNSTDTHLTTVTECTTVSGTACGTNRTFSFAYSNGSYPNSITSVTSSANAGTGTLNVTFTYNADAQLTTSADADGNTTHYSYNGEGLLSTVQTPNQYNANPQSPGTLIWYDTSGRARFTQDPAAKAAGLNAITSYSYLCSSAAGTCSTDGTQTSTIVDPNGHETQDVFVDGMMTSQTKGVGSSVAAAWNYSFDQNTLGINTTTEPADGSGASYVTSYTDWYGVGSNLGNIQCTIKPGDSVSSGNVTSYTYNSYNEIATEANPLEQAQSTNGQCNTGTPTYQTTNYYGASNGVCNQTGLAAWLLACTVEQSGGSPASLTTTYAYADGNIGDVTTTTDANGNTTVATYDGYGNTLSSTVTATDQCGTACGNSDKTSYTYKPDGQVATRVEPNGNAPGANPAPWTTTDTYDAAGNKTAETDPGTLLSITGASWSSTTGRATLTFASNANPPPANAYIVVSGITPSGYNGTFQVYSSTSGTVQYTVGNPGTGSSSGSLVQETVDVYDSDGNLASERSPRGYVTGYTFDFDDRQLSVTDPASGNTASSETYDSVGNELTSTVYGASTSTTSFGYDALDRQTTKTVPGFSFATTGGSCSGGQATLSFASAAFPPVAYSYVVVSGVSPSSYDGTFQVLPPTSNTSVTYAVGTCLGYTGAGTVATASYDAYYPNGNSDYSVDADGNQTYTTYYPSELQHAVTQGYGTSDASTESYTYDAAGNTLTDTSGSNTTTNTYNDVSWTTTTKDSLGDTTTYGYDGLGNAITETDPGPSTALPTVTTHNIYDGANRLVSTCVDGVPSGTLCSGSSLKETTNTYDNDGNVTTETDANGDKWVSGGFVELGDQDLAQTSIDPTPLTTTTTYDADGNVSTVKNPDNQTTTYTYDGSDRNTQITYSTGSPGTLTYTYNRDGTVSSATGNTYTYDSQANMTSETEIYGEMQYTWDPAGNLSTIKYPDGKSVTYAYDHQNRMKSVSDWLGHTTSFTYDGAGNLATESAGNGTLTTYTSDQAERLDKIATTKSGTLMSFDASGTNGLAPNGNIQNMTTSQGSGYALAPGAYNAPGTDAYQYDPISRLTADTETGTGGENTTAAYSNSSELSTATESGASGLRQGTYNYQTTGRDAGQLQSITGSGSPTFAFSKEGNRTCLGTGTGCSTPTDTYTYDQANNLTGWSNGYDNGVLSYDANGLLTSDMYSFPGPCPSRPPAAPTHSSSIKPLAITVCNSDNQLTWNTAQGSPMLGVYTETSYDGTDLHTDMIDGPQGQPVEQVTYDGTTGTWTPEYYYQDFQGNTRAILGQSANLELNYNYPSYGVTSSWFGNGYATPLQYSGQLTDQWSGMTYNSNGGGWYDPSTGQFVSESTAFGPNVASSAYNFASDNPVHAASGWCKHHGCARAAKRLHIASTFPRGPNCIDQTGQWECGPASGDSAAIDGWLSWDGSSVWIARLSGSSSVCHVPRFIASNTMQSATVFDFSKSCEIQHRLHTRRLVINNAFAVDVCSDSNILGGCARHHYYKTAPGKPAVWLHARSNGTYTFGFNNLKWNGQCPPTPAGLGCISA